ncbi:forkhead box protein P3 [Bombina bombina]|uniref:forkhead box protein P3 n=1 Tax=Bombina bombina TaxID=8345 RepID=UPI00235A7C2B|nr:forkhead box protein P3 [Bombina bombina]
MASHTVSCGSSLTPSGVFLKAEIAAQVSSVVSAALAEFSRIQGKRKRKFKNSDSKVFVPSSDSQVPHRSEDESHSEVFPVPDCAKEIITQEWEKPGVAFTPSPVFKRLFPVETSIKDPCPQNIKFMQAPMVVSDPKYREKGKEQSTPSNRKSTGVGSQPQQHRKPHVMVTSSGPFSDSPHLRALLQENRQAVVVHPISRDSASQSPVIHLSPAASSSVLNLQPPNLFPVITRGCSETVCLVAGLSLTSLGWVQPELPLGKPEEVISGKNRSASALLHHPEVLNTEKTHKKSTGFTQSKDSTDLIYPLLYSGVCKFPGCEKAFADYHQCLKHLYNDHHIDDKRTVQCLIQSELVQNLEEQLAVEKQRLHDMQNQLNGKLSTQIAHLSKQSEHGTTLIPVYPGICARTGLDLSLPVPKDFSDTNLTVRRQIWGNTSILQNAANCIEYYKTNTVRPPFTYASLIRWAILESPQRQLALSEIYHWFTRMFAYFRFNSATWKNAVRHNLSLHKCFVRVENIKGAVWMVDEMEFQRKKAVRSFH